MWIVDPCLTGLSGHHYSAALALSRLLPECGARVRVMASRAFRGDDFGPEAQVFREGFYDFDRWNRWIWHRLALRHAEDLAGAADREPLPDLVILPTADQAQLLALARYLGRTPGPRPDVALWLIRDPRFIRSLAVTDAAMQAAQYREAFGLLGQVLGGAALRIFVETPELQALYADLLGRPVERSDYISATDGTARAPAGDADSRLTVATLGFYAEGKGYELLPDAVRTAQASRPELRFRVHACGCPRALADALARVLGPGDLMTDDLDAGTYAALLGAADLVLLPYSPALYGGRGSGVFTEARRLGIPTAAPADCAFSAAAIAGGACQPIAAYTAPAVAAAVVAAAERHDTLAAAARAHAAALGENPFLSAVRGLAAAPAAGADLPGEVFPPSLGREMAVSRALCWLVHPARLPGLRKTRRLWREYRARRAARQS